jgi:mRNA interferase RelE/StbE
MLALEPVIRDRLDAFLSVGVATNPRRVGRALEGRLKGFWRYKVGEYRVICRIEDMRRALVVVAVGHRADIYRELPPQ